MLLAQNVVNRNMTAFRGHWIQIFQRKKDISIQLKTLYAFFKDVCVLKIWNVFSENNIEVIFWPWAGIIFYVLYFLKLNLQIIYSVLMNWIHSSHVSHKVIVHSSGQTFAVQLYRKSRWHSWAAWRTQKFQSWD